MSITSKPKDFQKLFLDMDSFFASIEQQVQPTLRNVPIGITPYVGDTGCIIAASKEAKKLGIKVGCLVKDAKRIIPNIKIIESRPALYTIYHKEIKCIVNSLTPFNKALSIDEFLINLSPSEQNENSATKLAIEIKNKIKDNVGDYLTCSIGIAPNGFLAKMAGEREKPDGLNILKLKNIESFYKNLPDLKDITGINFRMEINLKNFGIYSPLKFYKTSLTQLRRFLHHWGRLWFYRLRGYEVDEIVSKTKTIGHSHVLAPELRDPQKAKSVIKKLIYKVGYRLRQKNCGAKGVFVSIRFLNHTNFYQSLSTPIFSDNFTLTKYIFKILENCNWNNQVLRVAVSVFNLVPFSDNQISIFEDLEKSKRASIALDKISDKYGANTIVPASVFIANDSAPDRIPFGKPRYDIRNF